MQNFVLYTAFYVDMMKNEMTRASKLPELEFAHL